MSHNQSRNQILFPHAFTAAQQLSLCPRKKKNKSVVDKKMMMKRKGIKRKSMLVVVGFSSTCWYICLLPHKKNTVVYKRGSCVYKNLLKLRSSRLQSTTHTIYKYKYRWELHTQDWMQHTSIWGVVGQTGLFFGCTLFSIV